MTDYPLQHIVLFKYKAEVTNNDRAEVAKRFQALSHQCKRDGQVYIGSIKAGRQHSTEGYDQGLEHGFIVTFKNDADRDYYVSDDPAHDDFKSFVGPLIEKSVVFDFTEGAF